MLFPSENELFFGTGLKENLENLEKQVQLTNLDFYKIIPKLTSKPFKVIRYFELPTKSLVDYNIILYHYPGFVGHWTLLCKNDNKVYFFDPYGRDVDTQWPYLRGYEKYEIEYKILKSIIQNTNYSYNPYNIQGTLKERCESYTCKVVADNECGELVCYRILNKDLNDLEFFNKCLEVGPSRIFKVIKNIEKT
jgi:hypothetical protein